MTSLANAAGSTLATYAYDANGNMTCRMESGAMYKQTYNAENRISSIQKLRSGACADANPVLETKWDFAYDGDGVRTATLITPYDETGAPQSAALTSYYFGGAYEVTGTNIKKYYSFGGQTMMRDANGLQYFLSDHLGSVVAVTSDTGTLITQQRYLPFGAERTNIGVITQTDLGYTGQRDLGLGLMDYKARFYSPYLNRFIQPDTITPGGPQGLNRFSYVGNNPINLNDPTGHYACGDGEDRECGTGKKQNPAVGPNKPPKKPKGHEHRSWLPNASGNNVEFNIIAGIPLENTDHATIGLLYLSVGMVTDEDGGVQFYYTTLDQKYTPGSSEHMGGFSGENGEKDDAWGLGIGLYRGWIFGKDFRTGKFLGQGDSTSYSVLPASGGVFNPRDKKSNWTGVEIGVGAGFSMGGVSTDTKNIGDRIQLPPIWQTVCRINGYCGGIYKE